MNNYPIPKSQLPNNYNVYIYCPMNLKQTVGILLFYLFTTVIMAQDKPAYLLFDAKGKKINYKKALKKLSDADIIFFGESHDNPISHWLEFEVLKDLKEQLKKENLKVGVEMFERDQQEMLSQYLNGEIDEETFQDSLKLWRNYNTDYRPIVEYCKENGIPFFGTNVPRRFASMAYKGGIDTLLNLSEEEKSWIAPLPFHIEYELPSYQNMKTLMGGHGMDDEKLSRFIEAQATKDATMAHFTLENYTEGATIVHYNGSYHSDYKEGIAWYIRQKNPSLKIVNITTIEQESLNGLEEEYKNKADIVIAVPASMTKTYVFGMN